MLDEAIDEARAEYARLKPQYEAFAASVAALVSQLTETAGLDIEGVSCRAKNIDSLVTKLRHPGYTCLDDLTDKAGIRVITRYHRAVDSVVALLRTGNVRLHESPPPGPPAFEKGRACRIQPVPRFHRGDPGSINLAACLGYD